MRTSTRWTVLSLALAALLGVTAAGALAQSAPAVAPASSVSPPSTAAEKVLGTWRLNIPRSRYVPGPAPRSETRTYEPDGSAVKVTIRRVGIDGRGEVVEYTANFDSPAPVTGSWQIDSILMKRVDDFTSESVLSHAGQIFAVARRVIAQDGKTMTITLRRPGEDLINNNAFYDRVAAEGGK